MSFTQTQTFNINQSSVSLTQGDKLTFKFKLNGTTTSNFTASLSEGSLEIYSTAASTGYASTNCRYFNSSSLSASFANNINNVIIFSEGISTFHDRGYIFVPNPLTGSQSSLYGRYGDVDYSFSIKPYDIIVTYLSDNTYVESRVLETYVSSSLLHIRLDGDLSNLYKNNIVSGSYKSFILLSRKEDETNINLNFNKRPGDTSYGFLIPQDLASDVLDNIDTITKQVKQKLLADQQGLTT